MPNAALAIAGSISPMVFGWVVETTGNWTLLVAGAMGFLVLGKIMSFRIRPDRRITDIVAIGDATAKRGHISAILVLAALDDGKILVRGKSSFP
jgi:hypothetical protein